MRHAVGLSTEIESDTLYGHGANQKVPALRMNLPFPSDWTPFPQLET